MSILKVIILSVLFVMTNNAFASNNVYDTTEREFLRKTYYSAVENEEQIIKLKNYIEFKYTDNEKVYPPIILAYKAGIKALESKHTFWITTKYKYLVESMELFEKAVNKDPDNLEIRFMRFSILHYVPAIVGYSGERESDKNVIFDKLFEKDYSLVPKDIQAGMISFLTESDRLTDLQLTEINKLSAWLKNQ